MGYRSEVNYIIIDIEENGSLKDYIEYLILLDDENINIVLPTILISKDYNYIYYTNSSIKWYDEYEEIIAHNKIYKFDFPNLFNSENNLKFCSRFIRIGEELTDIEIEEFNSFNSENTFNRQSLSEGFYKVRELLDISISVNVNYEIVNDDNFMKLK
jgi:hypothetical protein